MKPKGGKNVIKASLELFNKICIITNEQTISKP